MKKERPLDANAGSRALFLSATTLSSRKSDGRLSLRSINQILEQIGHWHDGEIKDPQRHISPLRPHDLRHYLCVPAFRCDRPSEEVEGVEPRDTFEDVGEAIEKLYREHHWSYLGEVGRRINEVLAGVDEEAPELSS